ncbi:MAG: alpha-L-fucosidase [Clostridiales bacterium]|nr:alpha-L-fucosidase [Clostridiales bacterium]
MKSFEVSFDSLYNFRVPEWYRDAKFGIWSHWGPQSVPMFGDWYARNMYQEGSPAYEHHLRLYGHPSKFGYKDICALWKAEHFDPDGLIDLYIRCGAKFFAAQTTHHDNFFNYDSEVNPMNSVNVGPHKDICALWERAARKRGLPFGITEHLAASFSWWRFNKGADKFGPFKGVPYDGNDPAYRRFYHDNYCHVISDPNVNIPWYTQNEGFHEYWLKAVMEMIDKFRPDFLYSDGSLPFGRHWANKPQKCEDDDAYSYGLKAVSHLYNTSIAQYGENRALYLQKNKGPEIYKIGVLDCERSVLDMPSQDVWNTDTCIGNWFYHTDFQYKKPSHIIEMLVDIVSKNGCLMLNIPQRPDGTIDEESRFILEEIGEWLRLYGDGIYSSRPWRRCQEGNTSFAAGGEEAVQWQKDDVRYTAKGSTVFAFLMKPCPGATVALKAFDSGKVQKVIMNSVSELPFVHEFGTLLVKLPEKLPSAYVNMLNIFGEKL